jgi:hypothetical protein
MAVFLAANEHAWPHGTCIQHMSVLDGLQQNDEPASSIPALPSHCAEHCVHVFHAWADPVLLFIGEPLSIKLLPLWPALAPYLSHPPLTPPPQ